jgi:hypothetical protein
VAVEDGTLSNLLMGLNPCLIMAMVKCQEVLVVTDVVSRLRAQDGTRATARATASEMATPVIKVEHSMLLGNTITFCSMHKKWRISNDDTEEQAPGVNYGENNVVSRLCAGWWFTEA